MVLPEAMAAGLPIVAFDCPCGPSDIIHNNEDGILVEEENVQELAQGICYLIEKECERKAFGNNARRNVRRFSQGNVMEQWTDLFSHLTRSNKNR
jgi:glycosyltransferase involved in cell wall biosynthesis